MIHKGFIPDTIDDDHYVLGDAKLPQEVLQPNGDWTKFLPHEERQSSETLETCNCTAYGTHNALEILTKCIFATEPDFSERFTGINAHTRPPGNSPHVVCETIRQYGLIEEQILPFLPSITSLIDYYSPDPMTETLLARGQEFLNHFDFGHEWCFNGGTIEEKHTAIKESLRYSPVALSVYAWLPDASGTFYKPQGAMDNHWTVCYGYDEEGRYWKIFDSYPPFIKKVAWDTDFMQAKRFHLKKKDDITVKKIGIIEKLISLYYQMIELLKKKPMPTQTKNGATLYMVSKSLIGTHVIKPTSLTQFGVLGCMASLNAVFKKAFGVEIGGGASTADAVPFLKDQTRFEQVTWDEVLPGDIIMFATGSSGVNPAIHGHVFVAGNTWCMSNSSETGTWEAGHTYGMIKGYWIDQLGFSPMVFRVV